MTESAEQSHRSPPSPGFSGTFRDELAKLRGRDLGACAACGQSVFFEHNFTRFMGRVVHVRCPISGRTPAPTRRSVSS